jgi:hypothetical protein
MVALARDTADFDFKERVVFRQSARPEAVAWIRQMGLANYIQLQSRPAGD